MDSLVTEALKKVEEAIQKIDGFVSADHKKRMINRAVHNVDALKSALKALE